MIKQIISICILATVFISLASAQSCSAGYRYPFECVEEGMECNENRTCVYGTYCVPNPYLGGVKSVLADIGGSSFEPIPENICVKQGKIGESCLGDEYCLEGLSCYNSEGNYTCQLLSYAQLGEECSFDQQCYSDLKCDAYERECVADLSLSQVYSGYQCTSNFHCSYGFQCNTTSNLCVARASSGAECGNNVVDSFTYIYCKEDLLCNYNGSTSICTPLFSLAENAPCSGDELSGYNGIYYSPCSVGLECYAGACTKPTYSASSVNCTDVATPCTNFETCQCLNSTALEDATTGQCVPRYTNVEQTTCSQLTTELLSCAAEHECSDYAFFVQGDVSNLYKDSCIFEHCGSTICEIQGTCGVVSPVAAPTCGTPSADQTYMCQQLNSATSIAFSGSLIFLIVAALLF